jgi:hypothetical protein
MLTSNLAQRPEVNEPMSPSGMTENRPTVSTGWEKVLRSYPSTSGAKEGGFLSLDKE